MPGRGTVRIVVAGAPPPSKTIERIESELGWEFIQIYGFTETAPLLTINRAPAEWDDFDAPRSLLPGGPARRRWGCSSPSTPRARCWRARSSAFAGYRDSPSRPRPLGGRLVPYRRRGPPRRRTPGDLRPQEGRHHHGRGERVVDRGRGLPLPAPGRGRGGGDRRTRRSGPRRSRRWWSCARGGGTEAELIAHCRDRMAHFKAPTSVDSGALDRTATGKLQKYRLRQAYWAGREKLGQL